MQDAFILQMRDFKPEKAYCTGKKPVIRPRAPAGDAPERNFYVLPNGVKKGIIK